MDENDIGREVVDAAIAVHRELGPGLLETVYEVVLLAELRRSDAETRHHSNRQRPPGIESSWRSLRLGERKSEFERVHAPDGLRCASAAVNIMLYFHLFFKLMLAIFHLKPY